MILIAVSQRVDYHVNHQEHRDAADQRLIEFLLAAGFLSAPVPNSYCSELNNVTIPPLCEWLEVVNPKAIILSGGNDIGSNVRRDCTEAYLMQYAAEQRLPVIGLCRGMQLMAVWSGAQLKTVSNHAATRHHLHGEISGEVNSFHNYSLANCPVDYDVIARSDDFEIEAIRHREMPWEGWMWHPEREKLPQQRDIVRLKNLLINSNR